jgi:hypothetical protein
MKLEDLDAHVLRFKERGNSEFDSFVKFYGNVCRKWHRHVRRCAEVEKDEFYGRFWLLLYRSLTKFNPAYENEDDMPDSKFDRYFMAAVRKMCMSYKRTYILRKKRKVKQLHLSDNARIAAVSSDQDYVVIEDLISVFGDTIDREIVKMLVFGNSRQGVCESLGLKLHEYRARIGRIKRHPAIVSLITNT